MLPEHYFSFLTVPLTLADQNRHGQYGKYLINNSEYPDTLYRRYIGSFFLTTSYYKQRWLKIRVLGTRNCFKPPKSGKQGQPSEKAGQ